MNFHENYLISLAHLLIKDYLYIVYNNEMYFVSIQDINHNVEVTSILQSTRSFIDGEEILDCLLKYGKIANQFDFPKYYVDISHSYFNKLRNEANNNSNN